MDIREIMSIRTACNVALQEVRMFFLYAVEMIEGAHDNSSLIFSAASKTGRAVSKTVMPSSTAHERSTSLKEMPSARMIQETSARDATARVFLLAMTVTHAHPAGAFPMAMLRRSQQNTPVIFLDVTPLDFREKMPASISVWIVIILSFLSVVSLLI